jgi:GT2 family glycosyltransferase
MISFSVIVPTCHRNDDLEECLERLQIANSDESCPDSGNRCIAGKQSFQYEVIVTDDGIQSTAEGLVRGRFPAVKWVQGPHRGPAANRNFGASRAKGDWLVFIDDDCTPGAGWLEAYAVAVTANPKCAVFEGRTVPIGLKTRADQECPINLEGGHLWSCNFLIKQKLFFELGGFDERFPLASLEDIDFQKRLNEAEQSIKFVSGAQAEHPWRTRRGARFCIALAKSIEYFIAKYPAAKNIFVDTWGTKRIFKIFLFEFPRNLFHYRDGSSFRALYLDLLTAFHVSLAIARKTHPQYASTR